MQKRLRQESPEAKTYLDAINLFEDLTGLRLTIHDLTHRLWQFLPEDRFSHTHPLCQVVKNTLIGSDCKVFEISRFRPEAHKWKSGRTHRCHAGLVEIVVSVFDKGQLLFVLFAGPGQIDDSVTLDYEAPLSKFGPKFQEPRVRPYKENLKVITKKSLSQIREGLHQLGSRLRCLYLDYQERIEFHQNNYLGTIDQFQRKELIHQFAFEHHHQNIGVKDLSQVLCLSSERTRHVVGEIFGKSFNQLVREYRITAAEALLLNTQKSVEQISEECGFSNSSRFGQYFKQKHGVNPNRWRWINQG